MNKPAIVTIALFFTIYLPLHAQYDPVNRYQDDLEKLYLGKVETYTKMKKTGIGLGMAGGVLTVGGIALVSSANWETTPSGYGGSNVTATDSQGGTGVAMLVIGIPLAVTGIVLGTIGSKKTKSYQEKLNNLSVAFDRSSKSTKLAFTYKF